MKKITIDQQKCIGCGNCEYLCPKIFHLVDGRAKIKKEIDFKENERCIKEAIGGCPVEAISGER